MDKLSFANPVFAAYAAAAAVLIFKGVGMSWLTIVRMIQVNGGFRSPEDIRKTPMNPKPDAGQLQPNERVERARRIQQNDLESLPYFLVAGLLYVLTGPPLLLARCLLWGFVAFRLLHFAAYYTGRSHDVRAMLWTPGSLILVFMTACVLIAAFQG